jgi:hypothetical protein
MTAGRAHALGITDDAPIDLRKVEKFCFVEPHARSVAR